MSGLAQGAIGVLQAADLLPEAAKRLDLVGHFGDLLEPLGRAWELPGADGAVKRCRIDRLISSAKLGACLTYGVEGCGFPLGAWIGDRFIWWPRGFPRGRLVGLMSSRLPRRLDTQSDWIAALRAACVELNPQTDVLVCALSTTTARFVRRAAVHLKLRLLVLHEPRTTSIGCWLDKLEHLETTTDCEDTASAFISPLLSGGKSLPGAVRETPLRDRSVVALSDLLVVLHLRRASQSERLVRARLLDPMCGRNSVRVAVGTQLVPLDLASELAEVGATIWKPHDRALRDENAGRRNGLRSRHTGNSGKCRGSLREPDVLFAERTTTITRVQQRTTARLAPIVALPAEDDWSFLIHCTRRPPGTWPDQSEEEFLDELILDPDNVDRSPLAALRRIVEQQRIVATYKTIRGPWAGVCFTAVPLRELPKLRAFRPHRGRWDFEPYGICIRRSWLEQRGSQPVCYGEQQLWDALADEERPFFQRKASRSKHTNRTIDWQVEREWRHVGDVDLSELPAADGLVFVPSEQEASEIATASRWPVTVLR